MLIQFIDKVPAPYHVCLSYYHPNHSAQLSHSWSEACGYFLIYFGFGVLALIAPFLTLMRLLISALTLEYHSLFSVVLASSSECVTRPTSVLLPYLSGDWKDSFSFICLQCALQFITKLVYIGKVA